MIVFVSHPARGREVDLVWFHLVLWHINYCWLFNANSFLYIYLKYMICKYIMLIHTIKSLNSSIPNDSVQHRSTKLNGYNYNYVSLTIQLNISQLCYMQLNDQTDLFLTILFSISHLFALSLNVKQFYRTHR